MKNVKASREDANNGREGVAFAWSYRRNVPFPKAVLDCSKWQGSLGVDSNKVEDRFLLVLLDLPHEQGTPAEFLVAGRGSCRRRLCPRELRETLTMGFPKRTEKWWSHLSRCKQETKDHDSSSSRGEARLEDISLGFRHPLIPRRGSSSCF